MKNIVKSCKEDASSPLTSLPDEIILQILNKITDLKTICFCHLVSRSFSSIVVQVHAISLTVPLINPPIPDKNTVGDVRQSWPVPPIISWFKSKSFTLADRFLRKFKGVKSLCIELPSTSEIDIDNRCLFKWMVKVDSRFKSFMFLLPNSIFDMDGVCLKGNGDEDHNEVISGTFKQNYQNSLQCMMDAMARHLMLLYFIQNLQMLEKVSISDSGRRGRVSMSGEKLIKVKEWVQSASKTLFNHVKVPYVTSYSYIPVLKLPASGYVMKGIYFGLIKMKDLQVGNDDLMKSEDGLEDKEEALYNEAMMETLEKHKDAMLTFVDGVVV